MYIQRRFQLLPTLRWSIRTLPLILVWSAAITLAYTQLEWKWLAIPAMPVSVLGTAVSFYLGFKGNAAYGRLWEARKIWGGIVNTSRTWGIHVTGFVSNEDAHQRLIYRHVAWLAALRTRLRRPKPWEHRAPRNDVYRALRDTLDTSDARIESLMEPFLEDAELAHTMEAKNQATRLLHNQSNDLRALYEDGHIDDFRHMELAKLLETMFTLQGKAERIKNFPLPRQYATANHWFVWCFLLLVPMALLGALSGVSLSAWFTIPISLLLGWVFTTWDLVVDYSENPFEGLVSDIPMNSMSRTIEIDLRQILGETDLPEPIAPINDVAM